MGKRTGDNSDKPRQRAGNHTASAPSSQSAADMRARKRGIKKQGSKTGAGQDNGTAASDRPITSWRQDDDVTDNSYAANAANMVASSEVGAVGDANSREVSPEVMDNTLPGLAGSGLSFSGIAASNAEYVQGLFLEFHEHHITAEQLRYPQVEDLDAEMQLASMATTATAVANLRVAYRVLREGGVDPQAALEQAPAYAQLYLSAGRDYYHS